MMNQRAQRPPEWPDVVSIAELSLLAMPDDPMRTSEEVAIAVGEAWPFEVREVTQEAGNSTTFLFADGSTAVFSAWR